MEPEDIIEFEPDATAIAFVDDKNETVLEINDDPLELIATVDGKAVFTITEDNLELELSLVKAWAREIQRCIQHVEQMRKLTD